MQADSEESCSRWIDALQQGIDAAYHSNREEIHHEHAAPLHGKRGNSSNYLDRSSSDSLSTSTTGSFTTSTAGAISMTGNFKEFSSSNNHNGLNSNNPLANFFATHSQSNSPNSDCARILKVPGNNKCADCGSPEPIWASLNLGITLCIECSGVHRSLGVHLSKVRSLNLDRLECEQVNVMLELGNDVINQIYEAKWPIYEAANSDEKASPEDKQPNYTNNNDDHSLNSSIRLADASIDSSKSNSSFYIESGEKDSLLTANETAVSTNTQQPPTSVTTTPTHTNTINSKPVKIHHKSSRSERTAWIRAKYVDKLFVDKSVKLQITPNDEIKNNEEAAEMITEKNQDKSKEQNSVDEILCKVMSQLSSPGYFDKLQDSGDIIDHYYNLILYEAAGVRNLPLMARALAGDADVNWHNRFDRGRTPLYKAVTSDTMTACEYLLLNGAKCNEPDDDGCIALHYATRMGNTG